MPKAFNKRFPDLRFATFLNNSTEFGLEKKTVISFYLVLVAGESNASCLNLRVPVVRLFLREASKCWFLSVMYAELGNPLHGTVSFSRPSPHSPILRAVSEICSSVYLQSG